MTEIPNKSQEIIDWFFRQNDDRRKVETEAKKYAQDLMNGQIIAPDSPNGPEPLTCLFRPIKESNDVDFAFDFLEFYIGELKKQQIKTYWNRLIIFPYYRQFYNKFADYRALIKLLELCGTKQIPLPDNYWYLCYENPKLVFHKKNLNNYILVLDSLLHAIERQKGNASLKTKEIQRISNFKNLIENAIQHQFETDFVEENSFLMTEFFMPILQIEVEVNYKKEDLLRDAENVLLLVALLMDEGNNAVADFRKPISFQELSAKKISLNEFVGIDLEQVRNNNTVNFFENLGNLETTKFDQNSLIYHLFQRPYGPSLKNDRLSYLPENLKKDSEKRAFIYQALFKDYLLADIESPENTDFQEIWSFSTNTSHFFDAGNEWFGAKFWAVHNKVENKLTFILSSFTD
jgi:hypothetical protein